MHYIYTVRREITLKFRIPTSRMVPFSSEHVFSNVGMIDKYRFTGESMSQNRNFTAIILGLLLCTVVSVSVGGPRDVAGAEKNIQSGDSIFLSIDMGDNGIVAVPNPVRKISDNVVIMCRTRCTGTALLNIYDAVGHMVHSKTISLQQSDAVGYELRIPWDLRNSSKRIVGNGTYQGVVRIFDTENRLVARKKVNIGVACLQ